MLITIESPLSDTPICYLVSQLVKNLFNFEVELYDTNSAEINVYIFQEDEDSITVLESICEEVYKKFWDESLLLTLTEDDEGFEFEDEEGDI